MDTTETSSSSDAQISDGEDPQIDHHKTSDAIRELQAKNESLIAELQALRDSYCNLQSEHTEMENNLVMMEQQKDQALKHNVELVKAIREVSGDRDTLCDELRGLQASSKERQDELERRINEELKEKEGITNELEGSRERIRGLLDEKSEKVRVFSEQLVSLKSVEECLVRVIDNLDDVKAESPLDELKEARGEVELDEELKPFFVELMALSKIACTLEMRLSEYQETRKKEKRELENSLVSLTEENRDINSLLRIALVEKETVEKSLNKLRGNTEQRKVAILQIAERGLQKVGFGFMMGSGTNEQASDNSGANMGFKSDSSECDEEVASLASTVERIMKNLRLEITQLRRSLEESRSDTERLQTLMEKQAQKIAENTLYIKELEDREALLAQNIEELLVEIRETEEEVARWREACELEVEAGKTVVEERDNLVSILKQELEKTKAALDISNGKLKLKEELAAAAMAAQAAAERSLQLADSRAAGLRERIEELTRQLEETESRERSRRKLRHICWPWQILRVNHATSANAGVRNFRRRLPEMQALLR